MSYQFNQQSTEIQSVSLIIPTYNEAENIKELIPKVFNFLPKNSEIIVVDDNSPDKTWKTAEELSKDYNVKVIRRTNEKGLSSAVVHGFKVANNKILGVMDADLQHPPECIPKLIDEINNGADIVIGSRYVYGGKINEWSKRREIISKGSTFLTHTFIPKAKDIKDPMSGFFFFKKKVIDGVELNPIGYKILLEVVAKGNCQNIKEVPITFENRKHGKSNFNPKEVINFLIHLYRLSFENFAERFFKFCLIGLTGVFVNLGLLYLLTEFFGIYYLLSACVSIETSILTNFILNDIWTFRDRKEGNIFIRGLKFNAVSVGGLAINMGILFVLTEYFHIYYILSAIWGIVGATLWNFFVNYKWTWGKKD